MVDGHYNASMSIFNRESHQQICDAPCLRHAADQIHGRHSSFPPGRRVRVAWLTVYRAGGFCRAQVKHGPTYAISE